MPEHDYASSGAYFVTIRTYQSEALLEVPELHAILTEEWHALPNRFPGVTLDEFVIMPDHIHFILWLDKKTEDAPTLGNIVGAYKSLTTLAWLKHIKAAGLERSGRLWQRNYFEHILYSKVQLEQRRQYIRNNPTK
jgi:putative transposase